MTLKSLADGFHALRSYEDHALLGLFWASQGKTYRKGHCRVHQQDIISRRDNALIHQWPAARLSHQIKLDMK